MLQTSYIEISKSALAHNIQFIQKLIGDQVILSSVVKGNAYGHGIEEFVPLALTCGIQHFSVFSADEAKRVHAASQGSATLLIMGMIDIDSLDWAIQHDIEFYVFDQKRLEAASAVAKNLGKKAKIHIELETGMNRTGFEQSTLKPLAQYLKNNSEYIEVKAFCTHYAGSESISNYFRIKKQQSLFKKLVGKLNKAGITSEIIHTACSAASIRYPKTRMDLVRIGILQYGFFPSQEILIHYLNKHNEQEYPLRRIISWKSKVMDVKPIKSGEFVGYGNSYMANKDMKIALIPVGYSHGFNRSLSNQGRVLIRGQRHGVVGTVNMNMMSVDISANEEIQQGDEVVLIGHQKELEISVSSFSNYSDLLNYELLARLPESIPRIIVD